METLTSLFRIFAYNLIKPDIEIEYTATGSGDGQAAIAQPDPSVDFAGTDVDMPAADYANVSTTGR
jgi:ABC-type phosphate transport system substrate-binding protein